MLDGWELVIALVAVFLGATIMGTVSFGMALVVAPVLLLFLAPQSVVVIANLLIVILLVIVLFRVRQHLDFRLVREMAIGGLVAVPLGVLALKSADAAIEEQRVAVSNMRQTIARRLVESSTTIPHYQVSMVFDMDPLMEMRVMLNEQLQKTGVKLSVNDFLVRCSALAMYEHPDFNASWDGDAIIIHGEVNIGMAISVPPERGGGLVVGVIRNADQKSLRTISVESKRLAERARTRGLSIEEMSDSTFTISNLGMFGVDNFTAIINPPNSAIMAVGAAEQKPVVRDGALTIGYEMTATLSSDHRVIDGAMAARYLRTLKAFIENPATILA